MKTKSIIYLAFLYILCSVTFLLITGAQCSAQTIVKPTANGIYKSVSDTVQKKADIDTGKIYEDSKGAKYHIWQGAKGAYYIIRTSKETGKTYRQYLKLN